MVLRYLRSSRNAWAVALGLFALLLQILLPIGQAVAASRSTGDGFSKRIIVCTLYGPKLIYDARGVEVPPEDGGLVKCPTCVTHAVVALALAETPQIVLPLPPTRVAMRLGSHEVRLGGLYRPLSYQTRAPPIFL